MSISTYDELVTTILRRLHRSDMAGDIPGLITLAEKRVSARLRARVMNTKGTVTTAAGQVSAVLPLTLLSVKSMSIAGEYGTLDYLPPEMFAATYPDATYTGVPQAYTIIGDVAYFGPTPDAVYSVSVVFADTVTPLTALAPTNTLLTRWPNVYLYGALAESVDITKNFENGDRWEAKFRDAIEGVNLTDWHAGGPMRVRCDVRS